MTGFFVGRAQELKRLLALVNEPVAVIYGLPSMGKTELAYEAERILLARPECSHLRATHLAVPPNSTSLTQLILAALGKTGDHADLLRILASEPHFLVIDDAQLAASEAAALVDALMRQIGLASRLIVTSCEMLPVVTGPVSVTLGPFEADEAIAMVKQLADRFGSHVEDLDGLVAECGGIPSLLRRRITGQRKSLVMDNPIKGLIDTLDAPSHKLLVAFAAVATCSQAAIVALNLGDDDAYEKLTQCFLVTAGPHHFAVHEIVRRLILQAADPALVQTSQRDAANVLWANFKTSHAPIMAVESICLSMASSDFDEGFARLERANGTISKAGLDHLLLPILTCLANRGNCRALIALVRVHLRFSQIDAAARFVAMVPASYGESLPLHVARAKIAERTCRLDMATLEYGAAIELAHNARSRGVLQMRLAMVRALAGDQLAVQRLTAEIEINLGVPSDADFARFAWMRAGVQALQLRWREALYTLQDGRRAAQRIGAIDLDYLLVLVELLATSELGDVERSRVLSREVLGDDPSHYLRRRMANFYLGVAELAQGRATDAVVTLERAYHDYDNHDDVLLALIAGYFLGRALMLHGESQRAIEVLSTVVERANVAGVVALLGIGRLYLARALIDVGKLADGRTIAELLVRDVNDVIASEAHAVLAYAHAFAGNIDAARREIACGLSVIGDREPVRGNLVMDHAYIEILGGDPEIARTAALAIVEDEQRMRRPYARGRATLILAMADIAAGMTDTAIANLAEVDALANEFGMPQLRIRTGLVRNALAMHGASILERVPLEHQRGYLGVLRVLGLRPETMVITGRHGREHTDAQGIPVVAQRHDILVDLASGMIYAKSGKSMEGRGVASLILATLNESREPVTAERLYQVVWGGLDYHPLRHRNTLYIALNRTRRLLEDLGEVREVIRRDGEGWRIASEIDLVVARRDPRVSMVQNTRLA